MKSSLQEMETDAPHPGEYSFIDKHLKTTVNKSIFRNYVFRKFIKGAQAVNYLKTLKNSPIENYLFNQIS